MFRVVCCNCLRELEPRDDGKRKEQVSHGVCEACVPLRARAGHTWTWAT
jgi:hypothetical protein